MKKIGLFIIAMGQLNSSMFGMQSENGEQKSNISVLQKENFVSRPNWVKSEKFVHVGEIQVHLGEKENLNENRSAHYTVLNNGEIVQHTGIENIVCRYPEKGKKQILQDQHLVHINIVGDHLTKEQFDTLKKILVDLRGQISNLISIKWCVSNESSFIPWLEEEGWYQYSDNIKQFRKFILSKPSSEISEINGNPVYWVPSLSQYSRNGKTPKVLNIFRVGKTAEEICINYMNRNKRISAHFTVDGSGNIFQHVALGKTAYFVNPAFGISEVGDKVAYNQIVIGVTGDIESTITQKQHESLIGLVEVLKDKFGIKDWTTPVPPTRESPVLEQDFLPNLNRLTEVYLTKDPLLANAQSLIYAYPATKFSAREGQYKDKVDTVVLSHTFTSWDANLKYLVLANRDGSSYHFMIGQDGTVVQHVNISDKAWHSGVSKDVRGQEGVNNFSVGIILANTGDYEDKYTDAQMQALSTLIQDIDNIGGHYKLYQVTTRGKVKQGEDAPRGLPWEKLHVDPSIKIVKHD